LPKWQGGISNHARLAEAGFLWEKMDPTAIIYCSVTLQIISAFLAIRLSLISGRRTAGLLILTAIALMLFRRSLSLHNALRGDPVILDFTAEVIALVISILFLAGIVYIIRLIQSHDKTAGTLRESQDVMETIIETAPT
jgi:hypothetical protein